MSEINANRIGGLWDGETKHQVGSVWDINGLSPTIDTMLGGGREPHIMEIWNVRNIYINSREGRRAWVFENGCNSSHGNWGGIAHTVTCREGALCVQHCNLIIEVEKLEEVKVIGNYMPSEHNDTGCTNTLTTVQKDNLVLEEQVLAYDEQNQTVRTETFGTLTTDGSSPKHNNRVIKIKQATKQGFIECEIGGGILFGISDKRVETRPSYRERTDKPDSNDGEYP